MRRSALFSVPAGLASLLLMLGLAACGPPHPNALVIGSKNFTEQVILGELLAQHIEARTGMKVQRRFYLAGSYICNQALIAGRIDAYVEYTGTALTAILKQPLDRDPLHALDTVRRLYKERYDVAAGPPLGFSNSFALIIPALRARELGISTISQAARYTPGWKLGAGYEFEERPDGLRGLEQTYGLRFRGQPKVMDLGLLYRAMSEGQVDAVAGNSTDGPIEALIESRPRTAITSVDLRTTQSPNQLLGRLRDRAEEYPCGRQLIWKAVQAGRKPRPARDEKVVRKGKLK